MKKLTCKQLHSLLLKHELDPRVGWFYNQFKKKFKKEAWIDNTSWVITLNNIITFLENEKINTILFFQEPNDKSNHSCILKRKELNLFFMKNYIPWTNNHFADKDLKWIVTITHEGDTRISGDKYFVANFSKLFK